MQPVVLSSIPSSLQVADGSSKEESVSFNTAFIHLHSLASRDISLPCPQEILGVIQQLLVEVVVFYEQLAVSRESYFTPEENDRLALYGQEFHLRLQFITNRIGERLMEAMLWAWLHSLLQGEKQWRQDLAYDKSMEHSSLLLCDFAASTGLIGRIKCRVKDASALRRVIVFTFEALRRISTLAPPIYTAEPDQLASQPPAYSLQATQSTSTKEAKSFTPIADNTFCSIENRREYGGWATTFTKTPSESRAMKAGDDTSKQRQAEPPHHRQGSQMMTRSIAKQQRFASLMRPVKESNTHHLDLQTDFSEWLQSPPLHKLRIDHRLERRHWSLEQLANPILSTD